MTETLTEMVYLTNTMLIHMIEMYKLRNKDEIEMQLTDETQLRLVVDQVVIVVTVELSVLG